MIALTLAELRRLRSRRMAWITAVALLAVVGLFQLVVDDEVTPPSASQVTSQQHYFDESHADWVQNHAAQEQSCVDDGGTQADCAVSEPTPADYALTPTSFADVAPTAVQLAAYAALLGSFLVGASFIGAEYSSGSLASWLTFVPRRLPVYFSKLAAVVIGAAAAGAVTSFAMLGLTALVTRLHGGALPTLGAVAADAGRAVPVACLAAVAGFVFALLSRHTVAALGIALGSVVVSVVLASPVQDADGPLGWLPPWLPENNVQAFLLHGSSYYQQVATVTADGSSSDFVEKHLSFGHSALYWLVLLVAAVVAGALVFRRRDVT